MALSLLVGGAVVTLPGSDAASAAPQLDPRPLVEELENLESPDGFVLSADGTTMYVLSAWGVGSIVDVSSRQITGSFPAIENLTYAESRPLQASGDQYALSVTGGYALLSLSTGTHEVFTLSPPQGEAAAPDLIQVVVSDDGRVTAIADTGEFLEIEGTTITKRSAIHAPGGWPSPTGISADGSLYFSTGNDLSDPDTESTVVTDMGSGAQLLKIPSSAYPWLFPTIFDTSGTSLWALTVDDAGNELTVNIDLTSGDEMLAIPASEAVSRALIASIAEDWFAAGGNPGKGGSLAPGSEVGGRELGCCTSAMLRLPGDGDLIYYDVEMRRVGFITAPLITDPVDAPIAALGETVTFTSDSEGLATTGTEQGSDPLSPIGSVWQSSPDGVTWTDIPGETTSSLTVEATAETYTLEYRRHFLDPYWGTAPSSAAARMTGLGPEITRPDNLPDGSAGKTYPGEIITATGQPGMTWSSTDLPKTLTLNPSTGEITGTPDAAGDFSFTVTVTDIFGTDSRLFNLHVGQAAVVPPGPDPDPGVTSPKPPELPNTGSGHWMPLAAVGAALLLAGAAGVLASRRRTTAL